MFYPADQRVMLTLQAHHYLLLESSCDGAGEPLDFGKGRWLDLGGGGIVTSTPAAHAALVKAIAQTVEAGHGPA